MGGPHGREVDGGASWPAAVRRHEHVVVSDRAMATVLGQPGVEGLSQAVGVLREWQYDGAPVQLHPGDLGWFWRFGAETTAPAVRTWSRDGQILAVGLLDGATLLRLAIAPDAQRDQEHRSPPAAPQQRGTGSDGGRAPRGQAAYPTAARAGHGLCR